MSARIRFGCPSAPLTLKSLLKRTQKSLCIGLTLAVAGHGALSLLTGRAEKHKAAKPLTTQFVKRQPRLTKPLELKKRPQPKQRAMQRRIVTAKARGERQEREARFLPAQVLGGLARPNTRIGRMADSRAVGIEPKTLSASVEGTREAEQKIDMPLEMLDIDALDTGRHHAMVIQDPGDRRNIRGFCHLAILYTRTLYYHSGDPAYSFERRLLPGFLRIPIAMSKYTDISTDILGRLSPDDAEILKAPWVLFFGSLRSFRLNAAELEGLGRYLVAGGFVFEDCRNYWDRFAEKEPAYLSLRHATLDALATQGVHAAFEKLPNTHPIYHCYFDFDGPPIGADAADNSIHADQVHILSYTEGVEIAGRLVGLLSGKCYGSAWTRWGREPPWKTWDPARAFQFAVNTIIFALTQEGSITHRLMDSVSY